MPTGEVNQLISIVRVDLQEIRVGAIFRTRRIEKITVERSIAAPNPHEGKLFVRDRHIHLIHQPHDDGVELILIRRQDAEGQTDPFALILTKLTVITGRTETSVTLLQVRRAIARVEATIATPGPEGVIRSIRVLRGAGRGKFALIRSRSDSGDIFQHEERAFFDFSIE